MGYSGNHPRFSRKEEMIHDRELIYDAKQQLHRADKAYKESPASKMDPMYNGKPGVQQGDFAQFSGSKAPTNYGTEHSSPVAMTDAASYRSKMAKHWSASNSRFDMPIMHDEAGRKGEGSPAMMNSPLHESKVKEGVKKGNSAAKASVRKQASSDSERAASRLGNANAKASAKARAKSDSERASMRKERDAQASKKTSSTNKEATAASIKTKSTPQSDEAAKSKKATKTTKSTPQSEGDKQRAVRTAEIKSGARDEMGYQTS